MSNDSTPTGWVNCTFGDVAKIRNGYAFKSEWFRKTKEQPDDVPLVRQSQLKDSKVDLTEAVYLSVDYLRDHPNFAIRRGDILIGMSGSIGKVCRYEDDVVSLQNQRTGKIDLRFEDAVDSRFLGLFLSTLERTLIEKAKGMGVQNISAKDIEKLPFPLPPLAEQKRIVAKIEELFSELEAGEESLRVARRQLGVYRQSLLKKAFKGKLTEKWRTQNHVSDSLPAVRAVTTDKELGTLDTLPSGWVWTHLSNVGELGRGKSKHRPRNDPKLFGGSYPFIQTGEVKAASKTVKTYTETYSEFGLAQSKLWPKGTLCITIAANIAETAFLGFDACFPDSVVGFVPVPALVNAEYIELFIRAVRSRIEEYAPATAQKNINLTTLENLVIPLCCLPEQQEIVRLLDSAVEVIERNDREIDGALRKSEALRQAILKKAFTGRLVPQILSDEPAAQLLARLRTGSEPLPTKAYSRSTEQQ